MYNSCRSAILTVICTAADIKEVLQRIAIKEEKQKQKQARIKEVLGRSARELKEWEVERNKQRDAHWASEAKKLQAYKEELRQLEKQKKKEDAVAREEYNNRKKRKRKNNAPELTKAEKKEIDRIRKQQTRKADAEKRAADLAKKREQTRARRGRTPSRNLQKSESADTESDSESERNNAD